MIDKNEFTRRIALALNLPVDSISSIAASILEADFDEPWESLVRNQLKETGIVDQWNSILDFQRAEYLAQEIKSLIPKPNPVILDILSGTGTIATVLRSLGCQVIEVERLAHYPLLENSGFVLDFDTERRKLEGISADVAIVVAAMHHEADLDNFLGWIATLKIERVIVIENLRTSETDFDLHQRMDWFFNRCLNSFGAECPGWYWDQKQWEILLGSLGKVRWFNTMKDVPGIPFTYDVFDIMR